MNYDTDCQVSDICFGVLFRNMWIVWSWNWLDLNHTNCRCQSTNTEDKTKRTLLDNASNLLTNLLNGGSLGSMPIAEGAVSDLFDRPLFFSLYDWFIEVMLVVRKSYFSSAIDIKGEGLNKIYIVIHICIHLCTHINIPPFLQIDDQNSLRSIVFTMLLNIWTTNIY